MEADAVELVCQEVVELVTEYLAGTLPPRDHARFEQHLATCPPCTAYLAQVRTTLDLAADLGSGDARPPAGDVARQLGDLFRRWHDGRKK
jgi:anti-sigma factor RsiW